MRKECAARLVDMGTRKQVITTAEAPRPGGSYSQGVSTGRMLFVAGQIPKDPATNELVEDDIRVQAERVFENVRAVLEAGGTGFEHVVQVTVYLGDLGEFAEMDQAFKRCFPVEPPARTTIGAKLRLGSRIVVDAIAMIP